MSARDVIDRIEAAVDALRGKKPKPETHAHRCWTCKNIWHHARDPSWTPAQHRQAHTCEVCGDHQFLVYEEDA